MSVQAYNCELRKEGKGYGHRQPPRACSKDQALQLVINAAELCMRDLKLANPRDKAEISSKLKSLLARAEQIKDSPDWSQEISVPTRPKVSPTRSSNETGDCAGKGRRSGELRSSRPLPKAEQILLLKASYLNGFRFPPWTVPPAPNEFEITDGEAPFVDSGVPSLSEEQEDQLEDWMRPVDALPPSSRSSDNRDNSGPTMSHSMKIDLVQDAATDCSLVASLCTMVSRAERGHPKLLRNMTYPYDDESGRPLMSKNGKYVIKLNFNGCYRKVVIDDRLPVSNSDRIIHLMDKNNPGLLWPALIEKAYLKVRGGYDLPGSNSATDLWILTGWIPEQVLLQKPDVAPDSLWRRLATGLLHGDVLITTGTGRMATETEQDLGLADEHAYAVLDLRVVEGERLILVKDPWCEGRSWRDRFKVDERIGPRQAVSQSLDELAAYSDGLRSSRELVDAEDDLSPGMFWYRWSSVMQHFESIYLNWNPELFTYRQDKHFAWDLSQIEEECQLRSPHASLIRHPQFTVNATEGGTVWILLSRYLRNTIAASATEQEIQAGRQVIDLNGHIALAAFTNHNHRALLVDNLIKRSEFVDSPHTLLKLDVCAAPQASYIIVPLEQDLMAIEQTFTISVFSNSPVTIGEASSRYPYSKVLTSAWTEETAGGMAQSAIFHTNPHFLLTVPQETKLSLLLEASSDELNVNVKLLHNRGQRIHSLRKRDLLFDSGDYRRACCVIESVVVEPGQYLIVCSTFDPQQLGAFTILVESDQPTQMVLLPREGAGGIKMELGTALFPHGQSRIAVALVPVRIVKLFALVGPSKERMSTGSSLNHSMVRLSIELVHGDQSSVLGVSNDGAYADIAAGVRTPDVDLSPTMTRSGAGCVWLVLERTHGSPNSLDQSFNVDLFVDLPDVIRFGEWQAFED